MKKQNFKSPLVTVVVPAYNEEKYLKETILTLRKQDYPNFEILVVNNASSDSTHKIAKEYADRVVFEPKKGFYFAMYKGLIEAKGEIIVRCDADTRPPKNWLKEICKAFSEDKDLVGVTGAGYFFEWKGVFRVMSAYFYTITMYISRILMGHHQLNGFNMAIRKSVVKKISPHLDDEVINDDMDLSCHISVYGKIKFISFLVPTSSRHFKRDPFFIFDYAYKFMRTILLHHPSHRLHNVK